MMNLNEIKEKIIKCKIFLYPLEKEDEIVPGIEEYHCVMFKRIRLYFLKNKDVIYAFAPGIGGLFSLKYENSPSGEIASLLLKKPMRIGE